MATTRGVGGLVKTATNVLAEVPGGERLVLQAVKDMLDELRNLRKVNARLERENGRLRERIERLSSSRARR
jgi:hypothetical protein